LFLTPIFDDMKKFAIVGEVETAKFHATCIGENGRLVAVCGHDETASESLAVEYKATAYSSFDDMLTNETELDVVVVCSAVGFHAEHIIKSLQAGKDVLCESPLCLTKAAAWQIIETEKYCGQRLYLVQTPILFEPLIEFKKQVDENRIEAKGFIVSVNLPLPESFYAGERGKLFPGGGLLYDPLGAVVDIILHLFGEIDSVLGFTDENKMNDSVEHYGTAALKMKSGLFGTIQWSGTCIGPTTIKIVGSNGNIETQVERPNWLSSSNNGKINDEAANAAGKKHYKAMYDDLFKSLRGEAVDFPGSLDGAKTVEAIEKIYKAFR
jgi:UDP-N-acetyl-2-amino-2-deoxyglucuronate dehydrogenase